MRFSSTRSKPSITRSLCAAFLLVLATTTCGDSTGPEEKPPLPALSSLDVRADSLSFTIGDSVMLMVDATTATGGYAGVADAEWVSRSPGVVRIVAPGVIRAVDAGRSWVVARNGPLADSVLAVTRAHIPLQLSSHADTLRAIGDTLLLRAETGPGPMPASIAWGSRDTAIVRAYPSGVVVARGPGSAWVVALEDGGSRDSSRVVVRQAVASVDVAPGSISRPAMRVQRFTATPRDARGAAIAGLDIAWSSADEGVATVDATGQATARAPGQTEIRGVVDGVTGAATLTVTPLPSLRFNSDTFEVGVGQYPSSWARPQPRVIADSLDPEEHFTVLLASSDTTIATVAPTTELPEESYVKESARFFPAGIRAGIVTLTSSADRYAPGRTVLHVTPATLHFWSGMDTVFGRGTVDLGGAIAVHVSTGDSLGHAHHNLAPLAIHVRSSDPSVVGPWDTTMVAGAESGGVAWSPRGVGLGMAWLVATADGYRPDSVLLEVQPRRLHFRKFYNQNAARVSVGVGQSTPYAEYEIEVADLGISDQTVKLTSIFGRASVPSTVTAQAGSRFATFAVTGVAPGRDTVIASAPGYSPDTLVVDVGTPSYLISNVPVAIDVVNLAVASVFVADAGGTMRVPSSGSKKVVLTSTDPAVLRPNADTLIIDDGTGGAGFSIEAFAPGSASIVASDPEGAYATLTSPPIAVAIAPMRLVFDTLQPTPPTVTLGMHQRLPADSRPFVYPSGVQTKRTVTLTSRNPALVRPEPEAVVVGGGDLHFDLVASDHTGASWIIASAPGMTTDSLRVEVGHPVARLAPPKPYYEGSATAKDLLRVELFDHAGRPRVATEDVSFGIASSNASVVTAEDGVLTVPAGAAFSPTTKLHFHAPGGSASLRGIDARAVPWSYGPVSSQLMEVNIYGQRVLTVLPPLPPATP